MSLKSKLLSCVAMLAVVVGIVVVGVLAASSNDFLFQGDVSYAVADKSLYVKDVQYQHGMSGDPVTVPGFRAGYINNGFELNIESAQISENSSGTFVLYFDIVNLVVDGQTHEYVASADWTGEPVSGVAFSIDKGSETISAGTVTPSALTDSTPVSGRVGLEIRTVVDQSFDLSNITVLFSQKANETEIEITPDTSGNGVVIDDYTGSGSNIVIPDTVGGQPVTSIGSSVFENNQNITTVTIPETVTKIDASAFNGCSNLTNINLPEGLTEIGAGAFRECGNLTDIVLPESLTTIGNAAFQSCRSITGILEIPANVEYIGTNALIVLGLSEFRVDPANQHFKAIDGILYSKDGTRLLTCPMENTQVDFVMPDTVETIDQHAFRSCKKVSGSLTLSKNLKTINIEAFYDCSNITGELTIPSSVQRIGDGAFAWCKFSKFIVESGNTHFVVDENGVLYTASMDRLIHFPRESEITEFQVPSSVTAIGAYAFIYCNKLQDITLPANLEYIGVSALHGCNGLSGALVLPNTLSFIGSQAFVDCMFTSISGLDNDYYTTVDGVLYNADITTLMCFPRGDNRAEFVLPDTVESFDPYSFRHSTLTCITIPASATSVSGNPFFECKQLHTVIIDSQAIAAMLSSKESAGMLIDSATTVYVAENAAGALPNEFFAMFSEKSSNMGGYKMYIKEK